MFRPLFILFVIVSFLSQVSAQTTSRVLIKYENKIRAFTVHTPPGYDGTERLPLVLNMHGFTMNGNQQMQYTGMNETSNLNNFIAVYPDGIDGRWATGAFFGIEHPYDDVGFLNTIVDYMTYSYNIDPLHSYTTGYSAGAFMSLGLACSSSSRFAAAAPVAGNMNYPILDSCSPDRKIPVAFFNGLADDIVPVTGFPGQFPPLADVIRFWSNNDQCDPVITEDTLPNTSLTDNSRVTLTIYPPCAGSGLVKFYKVLNGGHTWPGSDPGPLGNTNQDISANDIIWDFFTNYSIPENLTIDRPDPFTITSLGGNNYRISFAAVAGAASYEIQVWSPVDKVISKYFLSSTSKDIVITDTTALVAVGAIAPSGFKDWTIAQGLRAGIPSGNHSLFVEHALAKPYPNPVVDIFYIDLKRFSGTLSVYDIMGKLVYRETYINSSGKTQVNLKAIQAGMYFIQLENKQGKEVFKIVKQ